MSSTPKDIIVTFLGCGKLGGAILDGLLASISSSSPPSPSTDSKPSSPSFKIKSFIICTREKTEKKQTLELKYGPRSELVEILYDRNVEGVRRGDIIVLGWNAKIYHDRLREPGMAQALDGKIMISIMVGVSAEQILRSIYSGDEDTDNPPPPPPPPPRKNACAVINAIPNTAAAVRQSMTFIIHEEEDPNNPLPAHASTTITELCTLLGSIKYIPPSQRHLIPVYATIGASTAAFYALAIEGVVRESVAQGVPLQDALQVAAAVVKGTAEMMSSGIGGGQQQDDDILDAIRARIATPGGTTEKGLAFLEENAMPALMAQAVKITSDAARKAGSSSYSNSTKE